MGKEMVISSNRHETRLAVLEDDQLVEIYYQRANEYSLSGSIHKGRVTRVLPGMQSAFVDVGLERDAFLYVSDFFEDNEEYDRLVEERSAGAEKKGQARGGTAAAVPPPETRAAPVAPEAAPPPSAGPGSEPAPGEAGETQGRDKRGRRSRRRRFRGRGFPESKYASLETAPEESRGEREVTEKVEEAVEAAEAKAEANGDEFLLLPGESVAKYGRRYGGEAAGEESDEDEAPESEPVLLADLPDQLIPDSNAEEEPGALARAEETGSPEGLGGDEPEPVPAMDEMVEAKPATRLAAPRGPRVSPEGVGQAERIGLLQDISDSAQVRAEPGSEPEVSPAGTIGGAEPLAEDEGPEPARKPISLTATLREHGGSSRYLQQRTSRRLRRKMRNARAGENRAAEAPAQEPAPAPAEAVEAPKEPSAPEPRPDRPPLPSISELLREGQEILVQIAKEPLGQKGARITSHIALPGRYCVYMPTVEHIGVSRRIASDQERQRLKRILQAHRTGVPGGFIVRTAGEGRSESQIAEDMMYLYNLWLDIRQKAEARKAPALIHHDLDLTQRVLRDQLNPTFKNIWLDNEEHYESVVRFVQRFQPALVNRVRLYTRPEPIFDTFGITAELEKALRPKVWLKSGGYIVINQTEALVAIDVNTGKFVGKSNRLEDTILKTNLEAVKEISRQMRLRDLGGIIVVDFIDMDERKSRQRVMTALEEAMRADRAPYKVLQFNDFGLVAITRKRAKQSLERTLCAPCPYCEGAGYVKSVSTIISEILVEAQKMAPVLEGRDTVLRVHPEVAKLLKSHQNKYLEELEETLKRPVLVKSDPLLHQEKFDLV